MVNFAASTSIASTDVIRETAPHFSHLELSVDFAMHPVTDDLLDELRALRDQHNLTYTIHAPFRDINIASLNDAVYEAALADSLRSVELAITLGARLVNIHPGVHGYFPKQYYPEMKRRERDVIRRMCELAEPHNILISVENLIETNVHFEDTWTMDGVIDLVTQVNHPLLGFCLDTGHAFQASQDVAAAVRRFGAVQAGHRDSGTPLIHVHAQDNHGGPIDEHLPVGDGLIPWPDVRRALEETGFDGTIVFENFGLERQLKALHAWNALQPAV